MSKTERDGSVGNISRREFLKLSTFLGVRMLLPPPELLPNLEKEPSPKCRIIRTDRNGVPVHYKDRKTGEYKTFKPAYEIGAGAVFRAVDAGGGWALIYPDNGVYHGWYEDGDIFKDVYVRLEDFTHLKAESLTPITIHPGTRNQDKQVAVVKNGRFPYMLLLEGDQIISKVPVFLGGSFDNQWTKSKQHFVDVARVSRHMLHLHGVPFPLRFNGSGQNIHGAFWRNWTEIVRGGYGSAGCINAPTFQKDSPYNVLWDGFEIGFDQFIFRWMLSNLPFDPELEDQYETRSEEDGWITGEKSVRLLILDSIYGLYDHSTLANVKDQGRKTKWDKVVEQKKATQNDFLVPEMVGGQFSLRRLSFSK